MFNGRVGSRGSVWFANRGDSRESVHHRKSLIFSCEIPEDGMNSRNALLLLACGLLALFLLDD